MDAMRADRVEVSWDPEEWKWLVQIEAGLEAVRRHCETPKDADDQTLRSAVQKIVEDEGYQADPAQITIHR